MPKPSIQTVLGQIQEVDRVINALRQHAGRERVATLMPRMLLREDLELDSLDLAELTVRLQAKFGVDVFAKRNLRTVGDVVEELGGSGRPALGVGRRA